MVRTEGEGGGISGDGISRRMIPIFQREFGRKNIHSFNNNTTGTIGTTSADTYYRYRLRDHKTDLAIIESFYSSFSSLSSSLSSTFLTFVKTVYWQLNSTEPTFYRGF